MPVQPTIEMLQARVAVLTADLAASARYPRLEQIAPHFRAAKERELASHQAALQVLQQHEANRG